MGTIKLHGQFSNDLLELLVKGQYAGIGKNSSFGFGQYRIKETSPVRKISFSQTQSLYNRLTDRFFLESVLESMDKEIVDFDGITYSDVMDEKHLFINSIREKIENRTYQTSETQTFKKKKRNGQYRTIVVNNFTDRFVYKALSKLLSEAFENIFCENSFAYRVGYGHHKAVDKFLFYKSKGYQYGIKTDIEAFFDSIPLSKIYMLIRSFLFDDQITDFLESIIPADKVGLDQGNALSPLFSNIYMISFDTAIKNSPYVMIRYADDFVILSKTKQDNLYEFTENILNKLKLKLSLEKSVQFEPDSQVEFLGYMIEKDKAHKTGTIDNTDITWTHMFDHNKLRGVPVYISYYNSYVRTFVCLILYLIA
ncbi:MAG TPA: reverse transcriptase domain-containing protein, partial [Candidatus Cloacimonadota bacterium]|nr:reverse transcriptase domain-containing protein [Candidatus Cloacimonadota bacterium]